MKWTYGKHEHISFQHFRIESFRITSLNIQITDMIFKSQTNYERAYIGSHFQNFIENDREIIQTYSKIFDVPFDYTLISTISLKTFALMWNLKEKIEIYASQVQPNRFIDTITMHDAKFWLQYQINKKEKNEQNLCYNQN